MVRNLSSFAKNVHLKCIVNDISSKNIIFLSQFQTDENFVGSSREKPPTKKRNKVCVTNDTVFSIVGSYSYVSFK